MADAIHTILSDLEETREAREKLYVEFHQNPELSMEEEWTSQSIADVLDESGIEYHPVGKTGIVAIIANGDGPTVAMRGDIDALPVPEQSGKDYATSKEGVSHACGHDFHIMSVLTALQLFNNHKDQWHGTYIGVFQPGEETAQGAKNMVDNGIADVLPKLDVYLGQHVLASIPGGTVGSKPGPMFTAASSIRIKVFGKGSHGSMPELGVDPVVLASSIVLRLQTIVSREVAARDMAVVTVGSVQAGQKSNIIPDDATLLINTRAFDREVEKHVHEAIERIVKAECEAARSPKEPEIEYYDVYPPTNNAEEPYAKVRAAFDSYFGEDSIDITPQSASEDFSYIPDAVDAPYMYWGLGGFADQENAPGNHNPGFAPDLQPTLDRGAEAAVVAASAWLVGE
ncbi:amidohydrolase [Corynebacterium pyruviciproducens]|uniref:amidohydrolase n=1 Tax=Corynebacterium pyruviciproducens TaxID=598660 RepID=UPI00254CE231|nr:amidohydrolase [Corynebacterium pyruviciproducens]MDK7214716.1 amidohydrolase [Corynebacterium pyruviciproducens]